MPGARPYSVEHTLRHPLARMLPLQREQVQAYRLAEKHPPSGLLDGHGPTWEAVTAILNPRQTLEARVNLQRDFTLITIAVSTSSNINGGFRAQAFDVKRGRRFADRGVQQANIAGAGTLVGGISNPFMLREPYTFQDPDSQVLLIVQNLETVVNTVQVVLYGVALRFNEPQPYAVDFPGGPISTVALKYR